MKRTHLCIYRSSHIAQIDIRLGISSDKQTIFRQSHTCAHLGIYNPQYIRTDIGTDQYGRNEKIKRISDFIEQWVEHLTQGFENWGKKGVDDGNEKIINWLEGREDGVEDGVERTSDGVEEIE